MRHRKSGRQLNRNSSHRKAMFKNMAASLFEHEVIKTTLPKAKELRRVAEPLITLAKQDSVSNRRLAFDRLRDKAIVGKFCFDCQQLDGIMLVLPSIAEKHPLSCTVGQHASTTCCPKF